MAEFFGASMQVQVGNAPTTNDAISVARMAGFRAAKLGRKVPVLDGLRDPYNQHAQAWALLGQVLRRKFDACAVKLETASRLEVEWMVSLWSSRADAGSGTMVCKWLGDGFFGRGGHGDHRVFCESVEVVPLTQHKARYVSIMVGVHR